MTELGIVEKLLAEHPGGLEWHEPWHADHAADAMLRGRVDPLAVDAWLAEHGVRVADAEGQRGHPGAGADDARAPRASRRGSTT